MADRDAILTHFALPDSARFVRTAAALAASPPELRAYDAAPVQLVGGDGR
jgi:quinol monooxygenase YgiN